MELENQIFINKINGMYYDYSLFKALICNKFRKNRWAALDQEEDLGMAQLSKT